MSSNWRKVTELGSSHNPIWVNLDRVTAILAQGEQARIVFSYPIEPGTYISVIESAEEILAGVR